MPSHHRNIVEFESSQTYRNRSYISHKLDSGHFEALNTDGHATTLNGYCLDALDDLPAGGMESFVNRPAQIRNSRGYSAQEIRERNDLAEKLIDEILAEEHEETHLEVPR